MSKEFIFSRVSLFFLMTQKWTFSQKLSFQHLDKNSAFRKTHL